jgi:CHASE3 domain sensor protein
MRKNEESLQKDLTVLKKIEHFYNLESNLANQAKGYLVTNQNSLVELAPE